MSNGRFEIGHTETLEIKEKRIASSIASWKDRNEYIADIKHPYIYNSWRSFKFTIKGKKVGWDDSWNDYRTFHSDVSTTYIDGHRFQRINKTLPYGPLNFIWVPDNALSVLRDNTILLTYSGETLSLKEWSNKLGISFSAIKNRYHYQKAYSAEEIILGKKRPSRRVHLNASELSYQRVKDKASKMCSAYRLRDRKKRAEFNLTSDWLIKNILFQKCTYCGTSENIGCDRIDNKKGHTKDNVIPCCYVCNTVRGDNFTVDEMKVLGKHIAEINNNRLKLNNE